jgi:hypothetical protein
MAGSDEHHGRSRRPGVEDRGWSSTGRVLGGWMTERSSDAMCSPYRAQGDEECIFLVWPQNQGRWFLPVWPQNR